MCVVVYCLAFGRGDIARFTVRLYFHLPLACNEPASHSASQACKTTSLVLAAQSSPIKCWKMQDYPDACAALPSQVMKILAK